MENYESIYKEFINQGFTNLEAVGAASTIVEFPEIGRVWNSFDTRKVILDVAVNGVKPMNEQQQALINGLSKLTEKETEAYYLYLFEELSLGGVGRRLGIERNPAAKRVNKAKAKLAASHQGPLDWRNDQRIHEALDSLSERRKKCLTLRYIEGFSVSEVAQELDITYFSVKDMTKIAVSQLRIYMKAN